MILMVIGDVFILVVVMNGLDFDVWKFMGGSGDVLLSDITSEILKVLGSIKVFRFV